MTDKAERLHQLIEKMQATVAEMLIKNHAALGLPLWQVFQPLALDLGFTTYGDLRDQYLSLCRTLRDEVQSVGLKKESVRAGWLKTVERVERVFEAPNFGVQTATVFESHFTEADLQQLNVMSERLLSEGVLESSEEELSEAIQAVRDTVSEFEKYEHLDPRILNLVQLYLMQIERIYSECQMFGDGMFWLKYKEIFATFIQVHAAFDEADNKAEIGKKITIVGTKLMAKSIGGIKIPAPAAALAGDIFPALSGPKRG